MQNFQKLCAAVALIFVLSLPTLAGEITTMAVPPPPPPSASTMATEPNAIDNNEMQSPSESDTLITDVTLTILHLLSVF